MAWTARGFAKMLMREVCDQTGHHGHGGQSGPTCTCARWPWTSWPSTDPTGCPGGRELPALDEMTYRRAAMGPPPPDGFLACGRRLCSRKLEAQRRFHHGRYCPDVPGLRPLWEERLYKLFGVNAELLIDHAWGYEPCTVADIKAYRPENQQRQLRPGAALPL